MGKPSVPSPPDYSEVAAASEKAAELSYQTAQDQLAWAQQVYDENKVVLDPIVASYQQTLDFTNATAEADRARYEEVYQPLEDQLIAEAQAYASPERLQLEMGRAQAGVSQQYEASRQAAQQQLESYGLNPADTRYAALDIGTRTDEAAAAAAAGNQAYTQTQATADALRSEALNIGKGYPGMVASSYGTALSAGQQATSATNQAYSTGSQAMTAPSAYMSTGTDALGAWGTTLNAGYQNQMSAYNAQMAASSGIGSALGTLTGLVMPMIPGFQEGGEVQRPINYALGGGPVPQAASPTRGGRPDDVPANLTAGEFVVPADVANWYGSKKLYGDIEKARQERQEIASSGGPQGAVPASAPPRPMQQMTMRAPQAQMASQPARRPLPATPGMSGTLRPMGAPGALPAAPRMYAAEGGEVTSPGSAYSASLAYQDELRRRREEDDYYKQRYAEQVASSAPSPGAGPGAAFASSFASSYQPSQRQNKAAGGEVAPQWVWDPNRNQWVPAQPGEAAATGAVPEVAANRPLPRALSMNYQPPPPVAPGSVRPGYNLPPMNYQPPPPVSSPVRPGYQPAQMGAPPPPLAPGSVRPGYQLPQMGAPPPPLAAGSVRPGYQPGFMGASPPPLSQGYQPGFMGAAPPPLAPGSVRPGYRPGFMGAPPPFGIGLTDTARTPQGRPSRKPQGRPSPQAKTKSKGKASKAPEKKKLRDPYPGQLGAQEFARQGQNYLRGRSSFKGYDPLDKPAFGYTQEGGSGMFEAGVRAGEALRKKRAKEPAVAASPRKAG